MEEKPTRRVALLIEYDGTDFAGSQRQPGRRTVQGELEAALREFTGWPGRASFAGRTDAGVHARGQVAAAQVDTRWSSTTVRRALNHFLPPDLAVRAAFEAAPTFDPRRHACSRVYAYRIDDGAGRSPLRRRQSWQRAERLDEVAMARALSALPREPVDWAAFAGPVPDGYSTARTLLRAEVRRCSMGRIVVRLEADAFLPHQVRRTVGALERVGRGRLEPATFAALLAGPPSSVGPAAPPQGLTLEEVRYPPGALRWDVEKRDDD